ncbi:ATP-binding protein [Buttiauxella gaviniae]|uniref:ATP-binding protein n=1 Tax=Buttiauxella gaviniae TaxID=82990 RepID=UPI003975F310
MSRLTRAKSFLLLAITIFIPTPGVALTLQERAWISQQGIIPYTFVESWPLDYRHNGEHYGLSRGYLDYIERKTGLKFKMANGENEQPLVISTVSGDMFPQAQRQHWLFTDSWLVSNALIISPKTMPVIRNLEEIAGKRVAIRAGTWYETWLRDHYPGIDILPLTHTREVFRAVAEGHADIALGNDLVMRPLLNRYYSHSLAVAGQLPELITGISMGVSTEMPELVSILNKTLASITAGESEKLFRRWVDNQQLGSPTAGVIVTHYRWELALFGALLLTLIAALRRALVLKRRAINSESMKTHFLAIMSHEIRTPMNALIAALELLRQPGSEQRKKEYIDLAFSSSRSLLSLLNDILDHCRLTQKLLVLEPDRFCARLLVEAIADCHRPAAQHKGLILRLNINRRAGEKWIEADAQRLRQIINNLLSNAIKFTEYGSVGLAVWLEETPDQQHRLRVTVSDTGIGIAPAAQKKLFHAWQQVDNSLTRQYDGSGLGLFICRELVELMQGEITCHSDIGQGASFSFAIPVRCYAPQAAEIAAPAWSRFPAGISVLVVEDHPANQQMLQAQLTQLGCDSEVAGDGSTALALLEEENYYDVILLDCNLPDQDGYTVARKIRALEKQREGDITPLIAISAMNDEQHHQRCHASNINEVLTKPVTLATLGQALSRYCQPVVTSVQKTSMMVADPDQLTEWLLDDIQAFTNAASVDDRSLMIHHIHRVKGVAQMYQLTELSEHATKLEDYLRSDSALGAEQLKLWQEKLTNSVFSAAHL